MIELCRSNLEEFVSKTYALGKYNDIAIPIYDHTSEPCNEREVDSGSNLVTSKVSFLCPSILIIRTQNNMKQNVPKTEDRPDVSSFCSITEIVHAAETATVLSGYFFLIQLSSVIKYFQMKSLKNRTSVFEIFEQNDEHIFCDHQ